MERGARGAGIHRNGSPIEAMRGVDKKKLKWVLHDPG